MRLLRMIAFTLLLLAFVASGCETKEHADAEVQALRRAREVAKQAGTHASTMVTEELGVPECDHYLQSMNACLSDKVPSDDQVALRFELDSQTRTWTVMAGDPAQRAALPAQCRSATDLARQSTAKYGCEF